MGAAGFLADAAEYVVWRELEEGARVGKRCRTERKEAVRDAAFEDCSRWAAEDGGS